MKPTVQSADPFLARRTWSSIRPSKVAGQHREAGAERRLLKPACCEEKSLKDLDLGMFMQDPVLDGWAVSVDLLFFI